MFVDDSIKVEIVGLGLVIEGYFKSELEQKTIKEWRIEPKMRFLLNEG